jgi:spermidine/putrescine transport system substrate-binding protein
MKSAKTGFHPNKKVRFFIVFLYTALAIFFAYSQQLVDKIYTPSQKSLSLFLFSDVVTEEILKRFQEETGIKVNVKYCDTDAEIWTQLYASGGIGYDIISPTDHMVERMKKDNLLYKIDLDKITNYKNIEPFFNRETGIQRQLSVPFSWSFHGIGYRKSYFIKLGFDKTPDSWKYVFEPYLLLAENSIAKDLTHLTKLLAKYKICMVDEPLDILFIANLYFNATTEDFSQKNLDVLIEKLVAQKSFIRAYTSSNISYYLTRVSHCVLAISAHMKVASKVLEERFSFLIPQEGSVMTSQNLAIPKYSENVELAHQFINYILEDKTQRLLFEESGFLPTNKNALQELYNKDSIATLGIDNLNNFHRINQNLSFEKAYEAMLIIKTKNACS